VEVLALNDVPQNNI